MRPSKPAHSGGGAPPRAHAPTRPHMHTPSPFPRRRQRHGCTPPHFDRGTCMPGPQLHTIYSLAHELCVCAPPVRALPRPGHPQLPGIRRHAGDRLRGGRGRHPSLAQCAPTSRGTLTNARGISQPRWRGIPPLCQPCTSTRRTAGSARPRCHGMDPSGWCQRTGLALAAWPCCCEASCRDWATQARPASRGASMRVRSRRWPHWSAA